VVIFLVGFSQASILRGSPVVQSPAEKPAQGVEQRTLADPADLSRIRSSAFSFLKASQAADGSFSAQLGPGVTALVADAMMRNGIPPSDPAVAKALSYVQTFVHADGGIYGGPDHQNYETSIAIMCFNTANRDGRYDELIAKALQFEKKIQWDGDENVAPGDARSGGQGYGSGKRPDLSNTGMFIDALEELGTDDDDPALREAIKFVSNSQNLNTPYNTTRFAELVNDGGFYYTPAGDGDSKAGRTEKGGLRSYGSMTYIGFKSLLYAGLTAEDPRVRAARKWIESHYSLEENPELGQQGLYYYYHVFAKTMSAMNEPLFTDAEGKTHDWRTELVAALGKRQAANGSWVNPTDRWYEGDPNLVTGYALLALSYCD
jgi:squalene-hopene/tetraprenyl-beta-curcumene cyclase